ncbi:zinc metalloprotease HtpX [Legionella qingyii]|uniref:Protease HtpX n=1 Tax=Legionella qingyii TaxID=2184757 RepID=A0A317U4L7_9GAMM|nr:zinc metalloprotease HtpX [Legionella qingyii]PWY56904.1 zinc metalloprotease HtpX [Legionella qingyii]RUR24454.1 zinc metalloprotease HtpX [Legionella qingyii]RUR27103.1 zinc metalloprotease HtpX [Legionella qingyii]
MGLEDYHGSVGNWREQIQLNQRKTYGVIAFFVAIFFAVGFVADLFVLQSTYPQVTLQQCFLALIHLRVVPYATIIMVAIAIVSLLITYAFYDRIMLLGTDYHEITPQTARDLREQQLYNVVEEMKVAAGLQYMPRVFIIEADYMNAFASGYSEKSAMVAITRGLMEKLDRAELQAVMAHELSHIRHYDIKLTLTVAILSNILLIVVDILFYSAVFKRDGKREDNRLLMVIVILRYVLPLLTILLTLFLSRTREYMADAGCVQLMRDNEPLARALLKINDDHQQHAEHYSEEYGNTPHEQVRQASYLFDPSDIDPVKSLSNAFATHPSIDQRLQALGFTRK